MNYGIIPAAGRSSRLGRNKALLPLGDSVVLDRLVGALRQGGVGRIVVVTAPGDKALTRRCVLLELESACNCQPERGMLSSVLSGLQEIEGDMEASDTLVICPADYPTVKGRTVRRLIASVAADAAASFAVPVHEGKRGHPLVLNGSVAPVLRSLSPELGLRQLRHLHPRLEVEVNDRGVLDDLDTWEDYGSLERRVG